MKYLYLILLLFLISCSGKQQLTIVPQEQAVTSVVVTDSLIIIPPLQLHDVGSHLIFVTPASQQSLLFWDKKTQQTFPWGKMGSGPDDYFSAKCVGKVGKTLKLFDSNLRKYTEYELEITDSIIQTTAIKRMRIQPDSIVYVDMHAMENGNKVAFVGLGSEHLFGLLDDSLKIVRTFGDKPVKEMPEKNNLQLYGWMASHKNKLFFACQTFGYMVCYAVDDKNNIKKEWELLLSQPLYNSVRQRWEDENLLGFYDIVVNDDYIFASYSGKGYSEENPMPTNILVISHEGDILKNAKYQDKLGKLTLSGDGKIYSWGSDKLSYSVWTNWW